MIKIKHHTGSVKVDNKQLSKRFKKEEEYFLKSFGISCRYQTIEGENALDIGLEALKKFDNTIDISDVDLILFCSDGLEYKAPCTSIVFQDLANLPSSAMALDIPQGCSGFVYCLSVCKAYFSSGMASKAILITGDTPSKVSHKEDLELQAIFSDATAVTILDKNFSIGDFVVGCDGRGRDNLIVHSSATRNPVNKEWTTKYNNQLLNGRMEMNSTEIFKFALRTVPSLIKETLVKNKLNFEEVDYFVFHQASYHLLNILRKRIKIPTEKFIINIDDYGNTVSATIPIALEEMLDKGLKGKVLIAGFGIGYSWGATIIEI